MHSVVEIKTGHINMIWCIFVISLGLASAARNVKNVDPEYLESLRASGQDEEFAKLLGVDVSLVKSDDKEQRSDEFKLTNVSPLGDILLLEEQERQGIDFRKYGGSRWPNGRIPYAITGSDFSQDQINFIERAIRDFNNKVRNVQLVRRSRESDYVQIISGSGCWSYLGRIGGQQALSLQRNGCLSTGTVQHEFIHAAGFSHEQNRHDRDRYVKVLWDNIPENWRSQYYQNNNDYVDIESYDYYSVMHYPIWAPDSGGKDAFEILTNGIDRNRLGQNDGVTDMDVRKLNRHYS